MKLYDIRATIKGKDFVLLILYGSELRTHLDNSALKEIITSHVDDAFILFIKKMDEKVYAIDISPDVNYGAFPWECDFRKKIINEQLSIYSPLIQKFISGALTNSLDTRLLKQEKYVEDPRANGTKGESSNSKCMKMPYLSDDEMGKKLKATGVFSAILLLLLQLF